MRARVAAVALAAVVTAGLTSPAEAARGTDTTRTRQRQIGQQIESLRAAVAEASAEETGLLGQLDAFDERIRALSDEVGALDRRLQAARAEVDAAQARLDELEGRYRRAQADLARVRAELSDARDTLRQRAVTAYTEGPLLDAYADAYLTTDLREIAARGGYIDSVVRNRAAAVERYSQLKDHAVVAADRLAASRTDAVAQRDVVAAQRAQLQEVRSAQDSLRQSALSQANQRAGVLEEVRSRKAEFEGQIAALKAESERIGALLRTRQAGQVVQVSGRGILGSPLPGSTLTSRFGPRTHPIFGDVRTHTGVDYGAPSGTPVRAAADGEVVFAGGRGGYGNAVIVDHSGSLATLYAHLSRVLANDGDVVKRGQVIGLVGATGYATGPHLHFEVRVSGAPVNPLGYL